ncbi:hypothetical protein A3Q56_08084 [Intoshia linei]|uniref:Uncharacterized protein n=1 Tax=Intoshia linei TaxID=1819745 RepID=A0A177AS58_9BILA|nr:hypothetical protein A3Q56_08084 [Intoshia linei]
MQQQLMGGKPRCNTTRGASQREPMANNAKDEGA